MDSLELCKLNLESLILSTAEKYLPQLELVMTAPGIQSFAAIGIISEIGVDMSVFPTSKHLCSWAGLTPQNNESAGKVPGRRKPPESAGQVLTSSRCSFSALYAPFEPNSSRKSVIAISLSKSAGGTRKPSSPLPGCSLQLSTICSRRTNRTTLNSTARATGHLHTGKFPWKKPSSFYNGKVI